MVTVINTTTTNKPCVKLLTTTYLFPVNMYFDGVNIIRLHAPTTDNNQNTTAIYNTIIVIYKTSFIYCCLVIHIFQNVLTTGTCKRFRETLIHDWRDFDSVGKKTRK